MEKTIRTPEDLKVAARELVRYLRPQPEGATLITLSGELGAGKTAFVKAVAEALGIPDTVTSPTFVLEKMYMLPKNWPFARLVHIDAYRLEGGKELAPLGFDEIMRERTNLVFLEWPERVADALPPPTAKISIKALSDGSRIFTYA